MEKLPEDKILLFHSDTLLKVRQDWDLDKPGRIEESLKLLEEWIAKQSHFVRKDFNRGYLERLLVLSKGSVERAKEKLDKMCTLRTLTPHLYDVNNVKIDLAPLAQKLTLAVMPNLTENHERIVLGKLLTDALDTDTVYMCAKISAVLGEYLKRNDYSRGLIGIADGRCMDNLLHTLTKVNPILVCEIAKIFTDMYGLRLIRIFFISESKAAENFINVLLQFISKKISERILVVKSHTDLAKHLNAEILQLLPREYGGKEKPLKDLAHDLTEVLSLPENVEYFNEMKQFKTDEAYRLTDKFKEIYMGMPGSFRTLSVD